MLHKTTRAHYNASTLKKSVKSSQRSSKHHPDKNQWDAAADHADESGFLFGGSTFPSRVHSFNGLCNISTVLYALLYPEEGHTERGW